MKKYLYLVIFAYFMIITCPSSILAGFELKTNTATRIAVGPLVDPDDGVTAEVTLDVTALSVQLYQIKNDGSDVVRTQFTPTASGGNNDMILVPSSTDGTYDLELTAAQLNFLGNAQINFYDVDGFLVRFINLQVVNANWFNSKYSTDYLQVDPVQLGGSATPLDNLADTYDGTGYTNDSAPATQEQVGRLTSGSAAINTTAESFTKAGAEPETLTYTATVALDGSYHEVEDDATATDGYYQFDVGGNGVPVNVTWIGYAQSNGDSYTIHAYNYGGTAYEQIGSISASNGTTAITNTYDLTNAHVGTGANLGKVRFRFLSSDGTKFATDRIICSYAVVTKSVGYSNGLIWVDTNASNTNTEAYVDGTADNPVSTWAAALTLSSSLGIKGFHLASNSSITLSASSDNYYIQGFGASVALNGQSISGAFFEGPTITGNDDGSNAKAVQFRNCKLGGNTLGMFRANQCPLSGDIVLAEAVTYILEGCLSAIAGIDTPSVDFKDADETKYLNIRHYSGGIEVKNFGHGTATHKMSLEGDGQIVINANCSNADAGDELAIRGNFTVTDNVGSWGGTISDDARYDVAQINAEADTALVDYDPPSHTELVSEIDDVQSDIAGLNDLSSAQVNTEADTALVDIHLDHLFAVEYDPASKPGVATALLNELIESDGGISRYTANALEEAPTGGAAPTVEEIRTEMDSNSTQLAAIVEDTGTTIPALIAALNDLSVEEVSGGVWDEVLTGALHNIVNSAGRRLREVASTTIHSGTCQSGATANTIILDSGASASDGSYDPSLVAIIDGIGIGQSRLILEYKGSTRTGIVDRDWKVTPDNTSEFVLYAHPGRKHVNEGLAIGGDTNTITLNALASSANNVYNGQLVFIRSGTGQDQVGLITAYNGSTKVATVEDDWSVLPNATSGYVLLPSSIYSSSEIDTLIGNALATYDPPTKTEMDSGFSALNDIAVSDITGAIIEGTLTWAEIVRIGLAYQAGPSSKSGNVLRYKSVDGLTDRIIGTGISGARSNITLDGTP